MRHLILIICGLAALVSVLGFIKWAFAPSGKLPAFRVARTKLRLRLRLHPGRGFASAFQIWYRWSRFASFRQSARTRPALGFWTRLFRPGTHATWLGRVQYRLGLRMSIQEHLAVLGPPRSFKSGFLADKILRAQGSVVSVSTKPDMFNLTSGWRSHVGPVAVFNPMGTGNLPTTMRFNPVPGSHDETTAMRRGIAFAEAVRTEGTEGGDFWQGQAGVYLPAMFCAAALAEFDREPLAWAGDLRLVAHWAIAGDFHAPIKILRRFGKHPFADALTRMAGSNERTTQTVQMVFAQALQFMNDPKLASCVLPVPGEGFDIESFLLNKGTLYMIAEQRGEMSPLAPLFAMIVMEIHWIATQLGSQMRGERIDPPLQLNGDELTQTCPIPMPSLLADSGGRGIQVILTAHGIAQLEGRWKETGARAILDTTNHVYLPGILDSQTLRHASETCGEASFKARGEKHERIAAPACPPEMLRELPAKRALILRNSCAPVIARLPMAWRNWRYWLVRFKSLRKTSGFHGAALDVYCVPSLLDLPPEDLRVPRRAVPPRRAPWTPAPRSGGPGPAPGTPGRRPAAPEPPRPVPQLPDRHPSGETPVIPPGQEAVNGHGLDQAEESRNGQQPNGHQAAAGGRAGDAQTDAEQADADEPVARDPWDDGTEPESEVA
jgi:type IV secretion system protein VirD4